MSGAKPACRAAFKAHMREYMPQFLHERTAVAPRGYLAFDHPIGPQLRLRVLYGPLNGADGFLVEIGWLRSAQGYWSTSFYKDPLTEGSGIRVQQSCPAGARMMKQWRIFFPEDPIQCVFNTPERAVLAAIELCVMFGTDLFTEVVQREQPEALARWRAAVDTMRQKALSHGMDGEAYR